MTIRTRLAFWYAGVMFVSLVAMSLFCYFLFHGNAGNHALQEANVASEVIGEDQTEDFEKTFAIVFWCGVPAGMLAIAGGWWLMRKALAPIATLTKIADHINENNLNTQLPRTGNGDEFDRLTEVFNAMTARLHDSFGRIREFTLHASHELKTPLTILRGETEAALRDGALSSAERARATSQLDEFCRLTRIVDGLTLLAKADAGQIALQLAPVQFDELVRDNFADAQILAEAKNLKVELVACEAVCLPGDRHRLRQLLLNLTDNAVKYNQPQGRVAMSLRRVAGFAELTITNTGAGIALEILPRVFDRFFRGDLSHQNNNESCGLGLSIAQWIVRAHGGTIEITSRPAGLTTVIARLPAATTDQQPKLAVTTVASRDQKSN